MADKAQAEAPAATAKPRARACSSARNGLRNFWARGTGRRPAPAISPTMAKRVFDTMCAGGHEDIIAKRPDSRYGVHAHYLTAPYDPPGCNAGNREARRMTGIGAETTFELALRSVTTRSARLAQADIAPASCGRTPERFHLHRWDRQSAVLSGPTADPIRWGC